MTRSSFFQAAMRRMSRIAFSICALLILAGVATRSSAMTLQVSLQPGAQYSSIQDAVDHAGSMDTVLVHPGTYQEDVTLTGRAVVLLGLGGSAVTTIDATGQDSAAINLVRREPVGTEISGFTIKAGTGTAGQGGKTGGGVFAHTGSLHFHDNLVTGCSAAYGGGVHLGINYGSIDPPLPVYLVENCTIEQNYASFNGGGLEIEASLAVVKSCHFRNNESHFDGGGLEARLPAGTLEVSGNTFEENTAGDKGGGLRAFCNGDIACVGVAITKNLVVRNVARGEDFGESGAGGGMAVAFENIQVEYNTIVDNHGTSELECSGGGLLLTETSYTSARVVGNIIAFNSDCGIGCRDGGDAFADRNIIWANENGGVGNDRVRCEGQTQGGIIMLDPLFCNLDAHDYSLSSNSPAFSPGAPTIGAIDLPGCDRVAVVPTTWGRIKSLFYRE